MLGSKSVGLPCSFYECLKIHLGFDSWCWGYSRGFGVQKFRQAQYTYVSIAIRTIADLLVTKASHY